MIREFNSRECGNKIAHMMNFWPKISIFAAPAKTFKSGPRHFKSGLGPWARSLATWLFSDNCRPSNSFWIQAIFCP